MATWRNQTDEQKRRSIQKQKEWRENNHERDLANKRAYYQLNRAHKLEQSKKYQQATKENVLNVYGGKCACCGESHTELLSIDHINGGGTKQRRQLGGGGYVFYLWLIRHKFPEGFRVLCFNCNFAVGAFGKCPHGNVMLEVKPKREEERQLRLVS